MAFRAESRDRVAGVRLVVQRLQAFDAIGMAYAVRGDDGDLFPEDQALGSETESRLVETRVRLQIEQPAIAETVP